MSEHSGPVARALWRTLVAIVIASAAGVVGFLVYTAVWRSGFERWWAVACLVVCALASAGVLAERKGW